MYPIAMVGLLLLTSITVLLVIQNTLEILIGLKALPLSTRVGTSLNHQIMTAPIIDAYCSNSPWE